MGMIDFKDLPSPYRERLYNLWVGFDIERLMESNFYPINYFLAHANLDKAAASKDPEMFRFLETAEAIRKKIVG